MKKTDRGKPLCEIKNIPIDIAAEILGIHSQSLRLGLQRNEMPIGFAMKTSENYTYHISYEQLKNYVGIDRINDYEKQKLTEMSGTQISQ